MTDTPRPTPGPTPGPTPASVAGPADRPGPGPRQPDDSASRELGDSATGDIVIDAALLDLRDAPTEDLDAQIEAGRRVHRTLQGRLSDLGGA